MSSDRPNILLIVPHDLGTHLGCYGRTGVDSPALDRLAREGVLFENHFCTAPYCSPSRGAILTGKHPHINGLMGLVNLGWDLPEGNATLAHLLRGAGYETLLFGTQHEVRDSARLDECFDRVSPREVPHFCQDVARDVVEFLEGRARDADGPFYARMGCFEVHRPWERYEPDALDRAAVPPFLEDTPGAREDFAMFHGAIRALDRAVGQILDALDRTGLADNTIVAFTTDHGIDFPRAKGTLYDPGIHTTLLMRWRGRLEPGRRVPEMISNVDLLPSLLDAAGIPTPAEVQGRSFWGLLKGGGYEPNECVYAELNTAPGDAKRCIRTESHKYIRNYDEGPALLLGTCSEISLTRRDMGNGHLSPRPPVELYSLLDDPLERTNLAGRPGMAQVESDLSSRLDAFMSETGDPIVAGPVPRPAGEAAIFERIWSELPGDSRHPMRDIRGYLERAEQLRRP
jgi:arylsulfatase A-like enzyme